MDLGDLLTRPTRDPNWAVTCLKAGVFPLVPLVGAIAFLGWQKRVAANYIAGSDALPDPFGDVGGDLGRGFSMFVAMLGGALPFVLAFMVLGCGGAMADGLLGGLGLVSLLVLFIQLPLYLVLVAFAPLLIAAHFRTGAMWLWPQIPVEIDRAKANLGTYGMVFAALILAGLISAAGAVACGVGIVFTVPFGALIQTAAITAWMRTNGTTGVALT